MVGDGKLRHASTRREWVAFRRWVTTFHGGEFHILGLPDRSFDWPHVEVPSPDIGFSTIDAAIARARNCRAARSGAPSAASCDFAPHLPPGR